MKRTLILTLTLCGALLAQAACNNHETANRNASTNGNAAANGNAATATTTNNASQANAASTSSAATTQTSAEAEKELSQLERDWAAAYVRGDAEAISRYIANDASLTDPGGAVYTKNDLVNAVKAGDLKFETLDVSDVKTKVYGDTAVVTYSSKSKGTFKGQDVSGEERWTDVFVRRGGQWECVASHGSSKPQPNKQKK